MRGVVVLVVRNDQIAEGRLFVEPVEVEGGDIEASLEQLYRAPTEDPAGDDAHD